MHGLKKRTTWTRGHSLILWGVLGLVLNYWVTAAIGAVYGQVFERTGETFYLWKGLGMVTVYVLATSWWFNSLRRSGIRTRREEQAREKDQPTDGSRDRESVRSDYTRLTGKPFPECESNRRAEDKLWAAMNQPGRRRLGVENPN